MTAGADLFAQALQHHQHGRIAEAEPIYRQILAGDPNHIGSLNFLGVIAHQNGRHEEAVDLIGKAIALNDRIPDCHNAMGEALRGLGRLDEAVTHFNQAVALDPAFAEAYNNLGGALATQDKLEQAAASYRRALALEPRLVKTRINLGNALKQLGLFKDAADAYREALTREADNPDARNNLGLALRLQGRLDEAAAEFSATIAHAPGFAEAYGNLGHTLHEQGRLDEAAARFRQALERKPDFAKALHGLGTVALAAGDAAAAIQAARAALAIKETPEATALFAHVLKAMRDLPQIEDLGGLLVRAMSEPWDRPLELARAAANFVKHDAAIGPIVRRAAAAGPRPLAPDRMPSPAERAALYRHDVLRCLLTSAPVPDADLERLLTLLRRLLLAEAAATTAGGRADADALDFHCALARQCFINDYVYWHGADEIEEAHRLRSRLSAALNSEAPIPAGWVAAVGSYFPLHSIAGAAALLQGTWPEAVSGLLDQQVRAPNAERDHRPAIPRLTEVEDAVSRQVQQQYEENPYPCWVKAAPAAPLAIDESIRSQFPLSAFRPLGKGEAIDLLIAGCGTGQHAVETAQRLPRARVLAVDLSLASLAYARRQARAHGLDNLEFGQADILKLESLGRSFDVIESSGVLHHLGDPAAGLSVLLSLLRPNGLMRLGFYSALARTNIVAARSFIAQGGYQPTPEGIRRCRQQLLTFGQGTPERNATESPDFFTTSTCRDLLFHVQEHRLTLPEVKALLAQSGLNFLGFEQDSFVLERYRRRFPADKPLTDLDSWHTFETENPRTFGAMYQFWAQRG